MESKKDRIKLADIVWLFVIGCLLGFVLETIWYYIKNGAWINKQGLLYGPFKPIYGLGLVFIILMMNNYRNKKFWQKFVIGVILGSAFEYFGSLFEEYILGTSTWNYSSFNLNIAGRIYLPYCLIWGLIAAFCVDFVYPSLKKIIVKVEGRAYNIVTVIVGVFMLGNLALTTIAAIRYSDRANNEGSTNVVFKVIDELYPDEYMQAKFPKMKVIKK